MVIRYRCAHLILLAGALAMSVAAQAQYNRLQTYGMLPLDPEKAASKGLTVNGIWAGYGMPEAVRSGMHVVSEGDEYPVRWSFETLQEYVDANHRAGLLVPATLMTIAGHPMARKRFPEMELGSCVGADGERAYWFPGPEGAYFMCANNPIYNEVLLTIGKEALDAGVDLIVLDEIQGNETCFYWGNQPGFCGHCLAAYRAHLGAKYTADELGEQYGIDDVAAFDFAGRLEGSRAKTWENTDLLFKELWRLQERQNFKAKSDLVRSLREHMKAIGNEVPICANVPSVAVVEWVGGHGFFGLKFAQIVDFLAMECGDTPEHKLLPEGKWVAYERLASAVFRYPSAALHLYDGMHAWETAFMEGKSDRSTYLYAMMAEANANGCHFVNYFTSRYFPDTEGLWDPCYRGQKFVREHRDLFEPEHATNAEAAILYIENEGQRKNTWAYVGLAKALAESHIPFDIVTDGGDGYVPVTLTLDKLAGYDVVVLPNALALAPPQQAAIAAYLAGGGTVITPAPEELGSLEAGQPGRVLGIPKVDLPERGPSDLGTAYHFTYDDALRQRIASLVNQHSANVLEVPGGDRTLSVYVHYQPTEKRILVHLINSDYNLEENRMRRKENVTIRLKRPDFYSLARQAQVYSPDLPPETSLSPAMDGEFISITLSELDVYTVILL